MIAFLSSTIYTKLDELALLLKEHDLPLMQLDPGYLKSTYHLGKNPVLISESDEKTSNRAIGT
jgi:hypothetical protein